MQKEHLRQCLLLAFCLKFNPKLNLKRIIYDFTDYPDFDFVEINLPCLL